MTIRTGAEYIESLRSRKIEVYLFGERVENPVDHPMIRSSIEAVAATYDLAVADPELASAMSSITGERVHRFLHVTTSVDDVVAQNRMQRRLGRMTGTCFQRCVGMDAINSLFSISFDCDAAHGTSYHERFRSFIAEIQRENLMIGGAMTDVKGDRSLSPGQQVDPDLYLRVVERRPDGVVIRGAKAHQTGCVNSHYLIVMPTTRLLPSEKDWAIVGAVPVDAEGLKFVYGRQSCDTRALEEGQGDVGNVRYGGQEAIAIFDDVFVPTDRIFLDGETEWAAPLVERFTAYHRRSYVCKSGVGDVLIGAAALLAEYHGTDRASHVRDKLVEMTHLNETVNGMGLAASHQSFARPSGNYEPDGLLANVCKHHVTRFPFEIARLAQDIAGGMVGTLPSAQDLAHETMGPLLDKYLRVKEGVRTSDRARALRLVENLTLGRNAVGYLTESMHGAGSPQAQRIQIERQGNLGEKKELAKRIAGIVTTLGLVLSLGAGASACRSRPRATDPATTTSTAPIETTPAPAPVLEELDESDVRLVGFAIPRGFVRSGGGDGLYTFRGLGVDSERLRRYVAERVEPGAVHALGPATTQYVQARVKANATDDGHRLDMMVVSVAGGSELQIRDIAPPMIPAGATQADRERAVNEAWQDGARD